MDSVVLTHVRVTVEGAVARLVLDRPHRLNALSRVVLRELIEASAWLDAHPAVKVTIVEGAGRAFSAGYDLEDFSVPEPDVSIADGADLGRRMADAVAAMRSVTIAAVHGWCVGGGLVLAAACDLRLAATTARFSIPEIELGIPLAWGGIPRLTRELGPAITKELVMTGRPFDAAEAHALRFVNRVVPPEELAAIATELAELLATRSTLTLVQTKRHVNAVAEQMGSTAGSGSDGFVFASAMADAESRAVGRAYLERRGTP